MKPVSLSRDPPPEHSTFEEDQTLDVVQAFVYRPGHACIVVPVSIQGHVIEDLDVLKKAARVWCLDEPIVAVQRVQDSHCISYVLDEVVGDQVFKRLILLDGLPARALWVGLPVSACDLACKLGLHGCAFRCQVNHGRQESVLDEVNDGTS